MQEAGAGLNAHVGADLSYTCYPFNIKDHTSGVGGKMLLFSRKSKEENPTIHRPLIH